MLPADDISANEGSTSEQAKSVCNTIARYDGPPEGLGPYVLGAIMYAYLPDSDRAMIDQAMKDERDHLWATSAPRALVYGPARGALVEMKTMSVEKCGEVMTSAMTSAALGWNGHKPDTYGLGMIEAISTLKDFRLIDQVTADQLIRSVSTALELQETQTQE